MSGWFEQAIAAFEEAAERAPKDTSPLLHMGLVQVDLGRHQDALATFERALEIDPASGKGIAGKALAQTGLGRLGEAQRTIDFGFSIRPGHRMLNYAQEDLNKARNP